MSLSAVAYGAMHAIIVMVTFLCACPHSVGCPWSGWVSTYNLVSLAICTFLLSACLMPTVQYPLTYRLYFRADYRAHLRNTVYTVRQRHCRYKAGTAWAGKYKLQDQLR